MTFSLPTSKGLGIFTEVHQMTVLSFEQYFVVGTPSLLFLPGLSCSKPD